MYKETFASYRTFPKPAAIVTPEPRQRNESSRYQQRAAFTQFRAKQPHKTLHTHYAGNVVTFFLFSCLKAYCKKNSNSFKCKMERMLS